MGCKSDWAIDELAQRNAISAEMNDRGMGNAEAARLIGLTGNRGMQKIRRYRRGEGNLLPAQVQALWEALSKLRDDAERHMAAAKASAPPSPADADPAEVPLATLATLPDNELAKKDPLKAWSQSRTLECCAILLHLAHNSRSDAVRRQCANDIIERGYGKVAVAESALDGWEGDVDPEYVATIDSAKSSALIRRALQASAPEELDAIEEAAKLLQQHNSGRVLDVVANRRKDIASVAQPELPSEPA